MAVLLDHIDANVFRYNFGSEVGKYFPKGFPPRARRLLTSVMTSRDSIGPEVAPSDGSVAQP
jgi:hypothetical protein